jgi:small subunit ribosomal protein S20
MPILKSAEKKLRQSRKKTVENKRVRDWYKSLISEFKKKPSQKAFPNVISAIAKSAKKKVIHQNKASRLTSRLAKLLKK